MKDVCWDEGKNGGGDDDGDKGGGKVDGDVAGGDEDGDKVDWLILCCLGGFAFWQTGNTVLNKLYSTSAKYG